VAGAVVVQALLMWERTGSQRIVGAGALCLGLLGALQAAELRRLRVPLAGVMLGVFWISASLWIRLEPTPNIDVLMFQQMGSEGLLRGENPYTPRYPNVYEAGTDFYGPSVVDANNFLTVGLPYPPLSLLLSLPGYVLGGDSRYADIAAVAASAALVLLSGPSRWTGLMAALFFTPRTLLVIEYGWTEALFAFTFSVLMFSAIRWRRALPYALGLFLATKQYSVFALPLVPLLGGFAGTRQRVGRVVAVALAIAAAITLPFLLWDPAAFWRSVVEFQFVQPLRTDALSHLVWIHKYLRQLPWQQVIPFVALVAALALSMWRMPAAPAYFAGAFGVAQLLFFSLSKQAFANYYFFVIATLCWAAAAASPAFDDEPGCDAG
jgi:hypothetical protein